MTSVEGVSIALKEVRAATGHITLFASLPCTWGSTMQNLWKHRGRSNPKYQRRMADLLLQLRQLMANFVILAKAVMDKRGDIVFEWPAYNRLWKQPETMAMVREFKLDMVKLHGCALGLTDTQGVPIKKPWCFATSIPEVVKAFSVRLCDGSHEHAVCTGPVLKNTENYSDEMARVVHKCIHARACGWSSTTSSSSGTSGGAGSSDSGARHDDTPPSPRERRLLPREVGG